jgi:hypothetical protein
MEDEENWGWTRVVVANIRRVALRWRDKERAFHGKKIRVGLLDRCAGSTRAKDSDSTAKNSFASRVLYAWKMARAIHIVTLIPCGLVSGYEYLRHTEYILTGALHTDMGMGEGKDVTVHAMPSCRMCTGIPPTHWPRQAPTALPPPKNPGTHWTENWVGPKTSLDVLEKGKISCPYRLRSTSKLKYTHIKKWLLRK